MGNWSNLELKSNILQSKNNVQSKSILKKMLWFTARQSKQLCYVFKIFLIEVLQRDVCNVFIDLFLSRNIDDCLRESTINIFNIFIRIFGRSMVMLNKLTAFLQLFFLFCNKYYTTNMCPGIIFYNIEAKYCPLRYLYTLLLLQLLWEKKNSFKLGMISYEEFVAYFAFPIDLIFL